MILLDTNVLSEPLKTKPYPKVIEWLDRQAAETLHLSTISYSELRFAVMRMPEGKRKNDLAARVEQGFTIQGPDTGVRCRSSGTLGSDPYPHRKDRQEDACTRRIHCCDRHGARLCRGDAERRALSGYGCFRNQPLGISSAEWLLRFSLFDIETAEA